MPNTLLDNLLQENKDRNTVLDTLLAGGRRRPSEPRQQPDAPRPTNVPLAADRTQQTLSEALTAPGFADIDRSVQSAAATLDRNSKLDELLQVGPRKLQPEQPGFDIAAAFAVPEPEPLPAAGIVDPQALPAERVPEPEETVEERQRRAAELTIGPAPEKTRGEKFTEFFTGRPEDKPAPLPKGAGRDERLAFAVKNAAAGPVRAFVKFGKGLLLGTPDIAFAAIARAFPKLELEGKTLDQAIDEAMGINPSGFSKAVSDVAEFAGGLKAVAGVLPKLPKSATVLDKAVRTGLQFSLQKSGREMSKALSQAIDGEADYQYQGAGGVVRDFGFGAGFSLLSSAGKPVLEAIGRSKVGQAISEGAHKAVIETTKRFPNIMDDIRPDPQAHFTKQVMRFVKQATGKTAKDMTKGEKAAVKHVAREAGRRFNIAMKNFRPSPDIIKRKPPPPGQITGEVGAPAVPPVSEAITPPSRPSPAPPVSKPPAKAPIPPAPTGAVEGKVSATTELDFKNLSAQSDQITAEVDDLIDKLVKEKSITLKEADRDPGVLKLEAKRDRIDEDIAREYGRRINKVFTDNGVDISDQATSIAGDIYRVPLIEKGGSITPASVNLAFEASSHIFSEDKEATIEKLAKRLLKDHLRSEGLTTGVFGRDSGLSKTEQKALVTRFADQAQKIHSEIEAAFVTEPKQKQLPTPAKAPIAPAKPEVRGSVGAARPGGQDAALQRAQRLADKSKGQMFVVQNAAGKFVVRKERPKKGGFTLVRPGLKPEFIKQASVTREEAFDFGEPIKFKKELTKLERFKDKIRQKNADIKSLQREFVQLVEGAIPPSNERAKALKLALQIRPEQQLKTNLRNFQRAIAKVGEITQNLRKGIAVAEFKKTRKALSEKFKLGKNPIGKLRPEFQSKVAAILDSIDPRTLSTRKEKDLASLQAKVQSLANTIAQGIDDTREAELELQGIPQSRVDELRRIGKTPLRSMTAQDIEFVNNQLKALVKLNELKNKLIFGQRTEDLSKTRDTMTGEIITTKAGKKKAAKPATTKVKERPLFKQFFGPEASVIDTLLEDSTGSIKNTTGKILYDDVIAGMDKKYKVRFEIKDDLQKELAKADITFKDMQTWKKNKNDLTINGQPFTLTDDEIMSIGMHTRNQDNFIAIQHGLKIGDVATGPLTPEQIFGITDKLSDKQLAMMDLAHPVFDEQLAPQLNEVSMSLEGFEKFTVDLYWPMRRTQPLRIIGAKTQLLPLSERGFTKERVGGKQSVRVIGFFDTMYTSIQESSAYIGMMEPLYNAKSIMSSPEWQEAMIKAGLKVEMRNIFKIFENTEGIATDSNSADMMGRFLLRNYARGKLGFNISSFLAQLTSEPLLAVEDLLGYLTHTARPSEALKQEMRKHSPTLRRRIDGIRIGRDIGDVMARGAENEFFFNKSPVLDKPLRGLSTFDTLVIGKAWRMARAHVKKTTDLTVGSDKYWNAVNDRTLFLVNRTQPTWEVFLRSNLLNTTNPFLRQGLMFRAPREKMYNIILRANDGVKNGVPNAKSNLLKAYAAVALSILLYRTMKEYYWNGTKKIPEWLGLKKTPTKKEAANIPFDIAEKVLYDLPALAPFGDYLAKIIEVPVKTVQGKTVWRWTPQSPLTDIAELSTRGILAELARAGVAFPDRKKREGRFQSGEHKREVKWPIHLRRAGDAALELAGDLAGLPVTGPKPLIEPFLDEEVIENIKKIVK